MCYKLLNVQHLHRKKKYIYAHTSRTISHTTEPRRFLYTYVYHLQIFIYIYIYIYIYIFIFISVLTVGNATYSDVAASCILPVLQPLIAKPLRHLSVSPSILYVFYMLDSSDSKCYNYFLIIYHNEPFSRSHQT
eukprot:gene8033-5588_t